VVLKRIWDAQHRLGVMHLMVGWISKSWATGLKTLGSTDPHGQSAQILTLLWDSLCEPLWSLRNDIFNNIPNPSTLQDLTDLRDRLMWYHRFVNQVLPPRFRFIASFHEDSIHRWDRARCRLVLRQLDMTRRIYEIECTQRVRGQQVLTTWFTPPTPSD
jgi:hypothetical protein